MTQDGQAVGKTALVTGAGKRIGRSIALDLAEHGWDIAIHYRHSEAEANAVAGLVRQHGGRAQTIQADFEREEQVARVVPAAAAALGPLGLLVNCASTFENDTIESASRQSWDAHIEPNLRAPIRLAQDFAAQAPAPSPGACIINILDQRVWNLTPYFMSYTISKYALWGATRSMALALAPRIRVNAIGPGPTIKSARQSDEQFQHLWEKVPLGRPTAPEEVARCVRFIVETPSLTGQMIALDGGEHLAWAQPGQTAPPQE